MVTMCGIIGVWSDNPRTTLDHLIDGIYYDKRRGKDAVAVLLVNPLTGMVYREQISQHPKDHDYIMMHQQFQSKVHDTGAIAGLGHTRYKTSGEANIHNIQPLQLSGGRYTIQIAHNGEIDAAPIKATGGCYDSSATSDTRWLGDLLLTKLNETDSAWDAVEYVMRTVRGAYSCIVWDGHELYAFRDPLGIRPLRWAVKGNTVIINSEDGLFKQMNDGLDYTIATVEPGQMIKVNGQGVISRQLVHGYSPRPCFFEDIYFSDSYSRPDVFYHGIPISNQEVRHMITRRFTEYYHSFTGDRVVPIRRSGDSYAQALAYFIKRPLTDAMRKKTDILTHEEATDRNFLKLAGERTHNFAYNWEEIRGHPIDSADDSIMRGDSIVRFCYDMARIGVKELWNNIFSPANFFGCRYGVATPTDTELLAHQLIADGMVSVRRPLEYDVHHVNEGVTRIIRQRILGETGMAADNIFVRYPPLKEFLEWLPERSYCSACISGDYPI
jgi:amidophosphoribosyltransferase